MMPRDQTLHAVNEIEQIRNIVEEMNANINYNSLSKEEIQSLKEIFELLIRTINKSTIELKKSEVRYQQIFDNAPILIRTVDKDGKILDCNQTYAQRFGFSKNEIIGTSIFDSVDEENKKRLEKTFETWKKTGHVENSEIWFRTKYGTMFPGILSSGMIFDDDGEMIGSNTIIKDISNLHFAKISQTEKIRTEAKLQELEKSNRLREELLSIVKHEFKTPLFPIIGYCEMLEEQLPKMDISDEQKGFFNGVFSNVKKLQSVLDNIIEIYSLEFENLFLENETINANEFLAGIYSDHKKRVEEQEIDFQKILEDQFVFFNADVNKMRKIFKHLLENAISFTPKNGKIEIGVNKKESFVRFYVKNTGKVIPKKEQEKIFDKFYQVDTSHTRTHMGMGLGLAICKKIVDKFSGKIWCVSKEEETTFHFTIPLHSKILEKKNG